MRMYPKLNRRSMLRPVLPAALDALLNMCTAFNASSEILGLVLENMTVVLSVSEGRCSARFCDCRICCDISWKIQILIKAVNGCTIQTFLIVSEGPDYLIHMHSSPLVRSTFCPMKMDHKCGLTLYPGYWLV